jgi:hypothetical protein
VTKFKSKHAFGKQTKAVPLAEGQSEAFPTLDAMPPKGGVIYTCRECFSRNIDGPIVATIDPRWVVALCRDCGTRTICTTHTPSPKEDTEGEPTPST